MTTLVKLCSQNTTARATYLICSVPTVCAKFSEAKWAVMVQLVCISSAVMASYFGNYTKRERCAVGYAGTKVLRRAC
jgi:hypothetical protein